VDSPFTFVGDNLIGTNTAGAALGNSGHGIVVNVPRDDYETTMQGNVVAFNGGDGISVVRSQHTQVRSNSIHSNGGLGIDLNHDGVTPNDIRDPDAGPNGFQNFPVIDTAQINQSTFRVHVAGDFNSTPDRRYRLDFYASAAPDPSGFGEGQKYVGSTDVTTNAAGAAHFNVSFLFASLPGRYLAATATLENATSEFSRAVSARIVGGPGIVVPPPEPFARIESARARAAVLDELDDDECL
jgi:parallel beta-helix repeat protein